MITNKIKSTPILYGEDAEKFEKAIENPKPVSKEELEQAKEAYKTFRKMGMYTMDDLKCCGNCKLNGSTESNLGSREVCLCGHDGGYCNLWQFDGLIKEDRK